MLKSFEETSVYFTQNSTTINSKVSAKSLLKIHIIPTRDKTNINSIVISYSNNSVHINEEIDDPNVFTSLIYSMKGNGETLISRAGEYMNQLEEDEVSVIIKEYSKYIKDGIVFDALVAGIGSYIALLALMENGAFVGQLPFEFGVPWSVASGNTVNGNMFRYMSLPLTSLRKISKDVLLQLVFFVESFINIWSPLFHSGPDIGTNNETRACIEIIGGFSQHILCMGDSLKEYVVENSDVPALRKLLENAVEKIVDISQKLEDSIIKINELSEQLELLKSTPVEKTEVKKTEIEKTEAPKTSLTIPNVRNKGIVQWRRK